MSYLLTGWSLAIATALLLALWLNVLRIAWFYYRQWRAARNIPGWPTHWLYGNLHQIRFDEETIERFRRFVYTNHYKITRTWMGPFYVSINLHHPSCVRDVFKHSKDANVYDKLKPWLGEGLLIAEGEKWHRNRRLLTPAFHYAILKPYVTVYNSCAELLIEKWRNTAAKGESVKLFDTICLASLDILLQCAFSYKSDCQTSKPQYVECVQSLIFACSDRYLNPFYRINWIYWLTPHGRRTSQLCKMVHDHADMVIQQRKKALKLASSQKSADTNTLLEEVSKSRRLDFLDILLTAVDKDGVGLSDLEIRNEVDTFMFEGHDTTTSGMCWTLYCLAQHPEHQQKVREEVKAVLSGRENLTYDDLKELEYTQCCIKEAMRLYPPVNIIFRQLDHDLEINGHVFPKGTHVNIPIRSIHNNPDVWPNPEVYDPMRFHPSNAKDRDPYAYLPFSAGSRNCIGQNFALNEEKTMVATIINHFKLTVDESHKVTVVPRIVLRAQNDIRLFIEPT